MFWAFHFLVLKGVHGVITFNWLRILNLTIIYSGRNDNVNPAHEVR